MNTVPRKDIVEKWGELLVQHGFIIAQDEDGNNVQDQYTYEKVGNVFLFKRKDGQPINPNHAMMEYAEEIDLAEPGQEGATEYTPTGYPAVAKRYHHLYESFSLSIEEVYFWLIDHIRYSQGWTRAYKVKDIFTATENSAFFGNSQQRLGIQQDRVQQYLATIGKMTKDLFQLVRELRILDEKLLPRKDWLTSKAADATLKGEFIDLVENRGGQTSPASVYGLAQQLGYATLPDLFFNTRVYAPEKVDEEVDRLDFNTNVKHVLKRKLYQFITWKLKTDHELESRRTFTLKYLRQHWDIIEMYMAWIKPYLRHIARLQMNESALEETDLIAAFEQSYIETETLFAKPKTDPEKGGLLEVLLLTINFRTRPSMSYVQEGYNKGPVHVGQCHIYFRAYEKWNEDHIENYLAYRKKEDLYMIGVVDRSVQAAMEALGDELEHYLAEAGEPKYADKLEKQKKEEEARFKKEKAAHGLFSGVSEPFVGVFKGFGEMFGVGGFIAKGGHGKKEKAKWTYPKSIRGLNGKIDGSLSISLYQTQKNFKKSHGMLSWG
jgi:hypothetical protein